MEHVKELADRLALLQEGMHSWFGRDDYYGPIDALPIDITDPQQIHHLHLCLRGANEMIRFAATLYDSLASVASASLPDDYDSGRTAGELGELEDPKEILDVVRDELAARAFKLEEVFVAADSLNRALSQLKREAQLGAEE